MSTNYHSKNSNKTAVNGGLSVNLFGMTEDSKSEKLRDFQDYRATMNVILIHFFTPQEVSFQVIKDGFYIKFSKFEMNYIRLLFYIMI